MFFVMGAGDKETLLGLEQMAVCPRCGRYGRLQVVMVCSVLSVFFIPLFRWNKRYYARFSCCGAYCPLDPELGRRIEKGEVQSLDERALVFTGGRQVHRCAACGYATEQDFDFCPKCGRPLE